MAMDVFPDSSSNGFFRMDDSVLSSLHELCDKFFDPCDRYPGAGITRFHFDGLEYVKELAESALKFYNEKEQKNLYVENVGKLNLFVTYYCLTFWARSAESDERHLFRGVVDVLGGVNVVLCEIKDGDAITSLVDNSEICRLKRSRSGAAVGRGGVDMGKLDGFYLRDDSWLSYLRDTCDRYFNPRDCDPVAGSTRFYSNGIENVNYLAELALKFYNEKEQKNLYVENVGKHNLFVTYYCLTFWARSAESNERHLFRGVVDVLGGVNVVLCEIKDGDELTSPVDSENCHRKRSRIDDYNTNDSADGSVDASSEAAVGRGGLDLGKVDGFCPRDDSWLSYLRDMCDRYFDPRDCDPGAGSTRFYSDGIENVNYLAELALKFYNEKERKNFYLEKVGKINKFVVLRCLTFWARTAESDESRLFRAVVDLLKYEVLLCEIKGGNEIRIPDNHSENCRLSRSRIPYYLANDTVGGSVDATSGATGGLGGVDLSSVDGSDVASGSLE